MSYQELQRQIRKKNIDVNNDDDDNDDVDDDDWSISLYRQL